MAKLTNRTITNLTFISSNYIVWDDEVKGLGIRISKNRKSFILKYRIGHGRKAIVKKQGIGKFGILNTEQARAIAKEWLSIAVQGKDPCEENNDQTSILLFCISLIKRTS